MKFTKKQAIDYFKKLGFDYIDIDIKTGLPILRKDNIDIILNVHRDNLD